MKKLLLIALALMCMSTAFIGCTKAQTVEDVEKGVELSPPWVTHAKKIAYFFAEDKEVDVTLDEDKNVLTIKTVTTEKGEALQALMGDGYDFGNIRLEYNIIPGNKKSSCKFTDYTHNALYKNPIFTLDKSVVIFGGTVNFVGFSNKLVQFPNDDISQYYLQWNGTYEDIAKTIFVNKESGIEYCTDIK